MLRWSNPFLQSLTGVPRDQQAHVKPHWLPQGPPPQLVHHHLGISTHLTARLGFVSHHCLPTQSGGGGALIVAGWGIHHLGVVTLNYVGNVGPMGT